MVGHALPEMQQEVLDLKYMKGINHMLVQENNQQHSGVQCFIRLKQHTRLTNDETFLLLLLLIRHHTFLHLELRLILWNVHETNWEVLRIFPWQKTY